VIPVLGKSIIVAYDVFPFRVLCRVLLCVGLTMESYNSYYLGLLGKAQTGREREVNARGATQEHNSIISLHPYPIQTTLTRRPINGDAAYCAFI